MSDRLLKAILKLLVIVAREDQVTQAERSSILNFLEENISKEEANKYLEYFDSLINGEESNTRAEYKEIITISNAVSKELSKEQKLVLLIRLIELIFADGKITSREKEFLYIISTSFNFKEKVIDSLMEFVQALKPEQFPVGNTLIISDSDDDKTQALKLKVSRLEGYLAFFHLSGVNLHFVKYVGRLALALNGQGLKPNQIKIFPNGSSIKGITTSITPIFYSDVISVFYKDTLEKRLSFNAENVDFHFPSGKKGIDNFNFSEENGRLLGIMGGSGSGKSTLLNILNGNKTPSSGSVRINGIDIHKDGKKAEGVIGYVPQDDLLMEDLTVFQNLFFAAKLCFKNKNHKELSNIVGKILMNLGLWDTKDLKVGNPLNKTISGGQRKRLNIGLELLREPSVLFIDEPTSGLSSRDSENIMDLLKELSLRGKMIFVVIHQPSSEIFKMFDKLIILDVGGYQIYYGNPIEAVTYFKTIVDHIDTKVGTCSSCGNVNPEQIFNIIETKVIDEYGRFTQKRKITPSQWGDYFQKNFKISKVADEKENPCKSILIPSKITQLKVFTQRDFYSKLSNRQYLLINLTEAPLLSLLLAFIVRFSPIGEEYSFRENLNIPVFFFMSVIVSLFMGLSVSAEEIIKDRMILKRESFLKLSKLSYLLSKILLLFFFSAIQTLSFTIIGVWVLEIKGMFFNYWLILFSVSCFANLLGLNISSAFNSAVTIYILIPILVIPQLILSGVVVRFDNLNTKITTLDRVPLIGEIMASRWAFEALAVIQFKDNDFSSKTYQMDRMVMNADYKIIYYIPKLLKINKSAMKFKLEGDIVKLDEELDLLRNEVDKELKLFGADKFDISKLDRDNYSEPVFRKLDRFLKTCQKVYSNKRKKASDQKEQFINKEFLDEDGNTYLKFRSEYENESISLMVKNTVSKNRIVRDGNRLIRKIYPIYAQPHPPKHILDFRTDFYYPEKYIAGTKVDTRVFNVMIIWFMIFSLFVMLYVDLLKKSINWKWGINKPYS